jgi:AraC-like DNA-binding protein
MARKVNDARKAVSHRHRDSLYNLRMTPQSSKAAFIRRISQAQLLRLFDFMPDFIFFIKDRAGRIVALNQRASESFRLQSERAAFGKTDHDFFPKTRADKYTRDDQTVMSTGRALVNHVESAPELEGSPRMVSTTKLPLRDGQGRVFGVIGFVRPLEQVRETPPNAVRLAKVVERMYLHPAAAHRCCDLARLAGLSVSQFDRCFRATFGATARDYLQRVRVEAACRRLAEGNDTIATIALECGFYDHAHFTRCFRKVMNMTPKAYRQAHHMPSVSK